MENWRSVSVKAKKINYFQNDLKIVIIIIQRITMILHFRYHPSKIKTAKEDILWIYLTN